MSNTRVINTIIYATDMGEHMRPVFRYAVSLAEQHGANIIMVHVMEPLTSTGNAVVEAYFSKEQLAQFHHQGMQEMLERMHQRVTQFCRDETGACPATGSTLVSDIVVSDGRPSQVIPAQAIDKGADLIVMGTCSHRLVGHGLLGSTAQRVIQNSRVPVMVVPNCDG